VPPAKVINQNVRGDDAVNGSAVGAGKKKIQGQWLAAMVTMVVGVL